MSPHPCGAEGAIVAAGATLANPGGFILLALKEISELDSSATESAIAWIAFALVSLLPLLAALVMLASHVSALCERSRPRGAGSSVTCGRSPPRSSWQSRRRCCATGSPDSSIAEGARLPERTPADHLAGRRGRLGD